MYKTIVELHVIQSYSIYILYISMYVMYSIDITYIDPDLTCIDQF